MLDPLTTGVTTMTRATTTAPGRLGSTALRRARAWASAAAAAVLFAVPLAAQQPAASRPAASRSTPMPGAVASKTTENEGAPVVTDAYHPPKLVKQTLTVRYLVDPGYPVTLLADGQTFACAPEPGAPTPVTACTTKANGRYVDLRAMYGQGTPLAPILPHVAGKQWNGACAGTAGDICRVAMAGPQVVGIDFYAKP